MHGSGVVGFHCGLVAAQRLLGSASALYAFGIADGVDGVALRIHRNAVDEVVDARHKAVGIMVGKYGQPFGDGYLSEYGRLVVGAFL